MKAKNQGAAAPRKRRYPLPDGYPVAASLVPDMPAETFHMMNTGALMASDCRQWGWREMLCARCETPLDLIYRHGPIPVAEFNKGTKHVLPGTTWGEDVTAICPRCSFAMVSAANAPTAPSESLSETRAAAHGEEK